MEINVRHDLRRLELALNAYPKEALAAGVRAINRTLIKVRAESARRLKVFYHGLMIGTIKKRLKVRRARRADPIGWLDFSGKRFSLYGEFGMVARKGARGQWGVRFRKLPWRIETVSGEVVSKEMLDRAFRQRGTAGRASVFARRNAQRLSHEVLVAPGLARALVEGNIESTLLRIGRMHFHGVFAKELKYRIAERSKITMLDDT